METSKPLQHSHFIVYKPYGYLSQFMSNDRHQRNKKFLGSLSYFPEGMMSIGRLDEDSEGLLLLTTDGLLSYKICSKSIEKEYYAQVDGRISDAAIGQLQQGVTIGLKSNTYATKPCQAFRLDQMPYLPERGKKIRDERHGPTSWISITINEGKFRQVRKMTSAVGFPTLRLVRVRIGRIYLNKMQPGDVIKVEELMVD